jgi:hypothetical protein
MLSLEYQALQIWRLSMKLTAIIEREGDGYVSLCPELDIASQGEQARITFAKCWNSSLKQHRPKRKNSVSMKKFS